MQFYLILFVEIEKVKMVFRLITICIVCIFLEYDYKEIFFFRFLFCEEFKNKYKRRHSLKTPFFVYLKKKIPLNQSER